MNLFIVNLDFPPTAGPGVWRALAIAKYAASSGHNVTVFCSDRSNWHKRTDPSLLTQLPNSVRVIRVSSIFLEDIISHLHSRSGNTRVLPVKKFLNWAARVVPRLWPDSAAHWALKTTRSARRHAKGSCPDAVITTGPPHIAHLVGYLLSKRFRTVWVMDYRDPWTDFEAAEQVLDGIYQRPLARWLENRFLSKASAVTVVSPDWLRLLAEREVTQRAKFHMVRNGHDLERNRVHELEAMRSRRDEGSYNPTSSVRVHFNGTIQTNNNVIKELFSALELLPKKGVDPCRVCFSFCGLPKDLLTSIKETLYGACVIDYGPLSHEESMRHCVEADALLVLVKGGERSRVGTIPAKVYEAIALGRHVLGVLPSVNDTRDLLIEYGNASLADSTDPHDIANTLVAMITEFDRLGQRLPLSNELSQVQMAEKFHRSNQVQGLLEMIKGLTLGVQKLKNNHKNMYIN